MEIGVVYPQTELGGDPDAVRRIGLATEELGYDHLLAYDHVLGATHDDRDPELWGPYTEKDPFHCPLVMFGYVAAITERIGLATGVLILPQRQTVLVAQQATDVDLLSGERLRLGVGVGWNYVEYQGLGQDFSTRGARCDEQIDLLRKLWTTDLLSFDGRFDTIDRANLNPRPNRRIPIWVGGFSEAAFRRGALLGDGFIFAGKHELCVQGWQRVRELRTEAGLSMDGYGADLVMTRAADAAGTVDTIRQWQDAGGTHASVVTMGHGFDSTEAHLDFMAEVKDLFDR